MKAWPNLPRLFRNGSVEIVLKKSRTFSSNEFCVALSNFSFENVELFDATFRICPKDDLSPIKYFLYTRAFPICCSVSNFFLLLTFVTYCALPELRRPVFGKLPSCSLSLSSRLIWWARLGTWHLRLRWFSAKFYPTLGMSTLIGWKI